MMYAIGNLHMMRSMSYFAIDSVIYLCFFEMVFNLFIIWVNFRFPFSIYF